MKEFLFINFQWVDFLVSLRCEIILHLVENEKFKVNCHGTQNLLNYNYIINNTYVT